MEYDFPFEIHGMGQPKSMFHDLLIDNFRPESYITITTNTISRFLPSSRTEPTLLISILPPSSRVDLPGYFTTFLILCIYLLHFIYDFLGNFRPGRMDDDKKGCAMKNVKVNKRIRRTTRKRSWSTTKPTWHSIAGYSRWSNYHNLYHFCILQKMLKTFETF